MAGRPAVMVRDCNRPMVTLPLSGARFGCTSAKHCSDSERRHSARLDTPPLYAPCHAPSHAPPQPGAIAYVRLPNKHTLICRHAKQVISSPNTLVGARKHCSSAPTTGFECLATPKVARRTRWPGARLSNQFVGHRAPLVIAAQGWPAVCGGAAIMSKLVGVAAAALSLVPSHVAAD